MQIYYQKMNSIQEVYEMTMLTKKQKDWTTKKRTHYPSIRGNILSNFEIMIFKCQTLMREFSLKRNLIFKNMFFYIIFHPTHSSTWQWWLVDTKYLKEFPWQWALHHTTQPNSKKPSPPTTWNWQWNNDSKENRNKDSFT